MANNVELQLARIYLQSDTLCIKDSNNNTLNIPHVKFKIITMSFNYKNIQAVLIIYASKYDKTFIKKI